MATEKPKPPEWTDLDAPDMFFAGDIEAWEKDKVLAGKLVRVRNIGTEDKPNYLADFIQENGDRQTWGVPSILKSYLDSIKGGTLVRAKCLGKIPLPNGFEAWDFKVQARKLDEKFDANKYIDNGRKAPATDELPF